MSASGDKPPVPVPAGPVVAPADSKEAAARLLTAKGLTLSGRNWLCTEDARLRRQVDSLERLMKQLHQARKTLDQRIDENEAAGRTLAEVERKLAAQQRLLAATTDAAVRRAATEELTRQTQTAIAMRARYLAPEAFASDPAVRTTLLEWISARNSLAVIALGYERSLAEVNSRYDALRSDQEIQGALAVLGRQLQLGAGRNQGAIAPQIDEARRVALAGDSPLYRVSGQWRSSLIIGDTTPAGCTLADQGPPLLLPETVARAAGVVIDAQTPSRSVVLTDGRNFVARVVQLQQVRLGSVVISRIEALVLPPEAEDVGVVLNGQATGGRKVELQPQRLKLVVR